MYHPKANIERLYTNRVNDDKINPSKIELQNDHFSIKEILNHNIRLDVTENTHEKQRQIFSK